MFLLCNFTYVPEEMQVATSLTATGFYTIARSVWAAKGGRRLAYEDRLN